MSGAKKDCLTDPNLTRDDSSKSIVILRALPMHLYVHMYNHTFVGEA